MAGYRGVVRGHRGEDRSSSRARPPPPMTSYPQARLGTEKMTLPKTLTRRALALTLAISSLTTGLIAPQPAAAAVRSRQARDVQRWSDPSTWGGQVPHGGATVEIPHGSKVLLDVSPPRLDGLQVDGLLTF